MPTDDSTRESEDWLDFRIEYVSGAIQLNQVEEYVTKLVDTDGNPAPEYLEADPWFRFYAANVGENVEAARLLINTWGAVTFDSGNLYVHPGDVVASEVYGPRPWQPGQHRLPVVWVRVFATSKSVVPSFQYDVVVRGVPIQPFPQATFSPADFAVFERHPGHRPPTNPPPVSSPASGDAPTR